MASGEASTQHRVVRTHLALDEHGQDEAGRRARRANQHVAPVPAVLGAVAGQWGALGHARAHMGGGTCGAAGGHAGRGMRTRAPHTAAAAPAGTAPTGSRTGCTPGRIARPIAFPGRRRATRRPPLCHVALLPCNWAVSEVPLAASGTSHLLIAVRPTAHGERIRRLSQTFDLRNRSLPRCTQPATAAAYSSPQSAMVTATRGTPSGEAASASALAGGSHGSRTQLSAFACHCQRWPVRATHRCVPGSSGPRAPSRAQRRRASLRARTHARKIKLGPQGGAAYSQGKEDWPACTTSTQPARRTVALGSSRPQGEVELQACAHTVSA